MNICYTAIGGSYDLPKNFKRSEGWEYVLFTNTSIEKEKHNGWKVVLVESELDDAKFARYCKHNPHILLKQFQSNISIWVDANLTVNANLNVLIEQLADFEFVTMNHPHRSCIYQEAEECIKQVKDSSEVILNQVNGYRQEGMPPNLGMIQSGILFRRHNNTNVVNFQEQWWNEVLNKSKRDQLSFNYIKWKNPDLINHIMVNAQQMLFDIKFFPIQPHIHGW